MCPSISWAFVFLAAAAANAHIALIKDHGAVVSHQPQVAYSDDTATNLLPLTKSSHFSNALDSIKLLDRIYEGQASSAFWKADDYHTASKAVAGTSETGKAILYGEIAPTALVQLLSHVGASPGQKFFDLGSGTGKSVFGAWLLGLDATGVELVPERWNTACQRAEFSRKIGLKQAKKGPGVSFVRDSFLNVDLSDADIVFINSVKFSKEMMAELAPVVGRMKSNAKVISTLGLPGKGFRYDEKVIAPTSWKLGTTWIIQTVIHTEGEARPGAASLMRKESAVQVQQGERVTLPVAAAVVPAMAAKAMPSAQTCSLAEGATVKEDAAPTLEQAPTKTQEDKAQTQI